MLPIINIAAFIDGFAKSPLARWNDFAPWEFVAHAPEVVRELVTVLPPNEFVLSGDVAIHRSATIEAGAILKGPLILGAGCFVASGAYLRGGNWVDEQCVIGPGVELKSSFVFAGTKLAHFNFVGDSMLGADVNLEAGSIVCNHRNERTDKQIMIRTSGGLQRVATEKFGALIGDGVRIGANAVVAPGSLLLPRSVVARGQVCDQEIEP